MSDATTALLERLEGVRLAGPSKWEARCPAHDDRKPSLTVAQAEDRVLLHCHAGCPPEDIVAGADLPGGTAALFDSHFQRAAQSSLGELVATYRY